MANSIRASQQGLEKVDRAWRKKYTSKKAQAWADAAGLSVSTLERFWYKKPIERTNFIKICKAVGIEDWEEIVDSTPLPQTSEANAIPELDKRRPPTPQNLQNWGSAPDVSVFYGRKNELATLEEWIVQDQCRLVALLGMGGIGKTALSVKFAQQFQEKFEYVIYRSLEHAQPLKELLADLLQVLPNDQQTDLSGNLNIAMTTLIYESLRKHRCLLLLDHVENIMRCEELAGQYQKGYEGYRILFRRVGDVSHQSCLLLVGRQKPREIETLQGEALPVRSLQLQGLDDKAAIDIFRTQGFSGSEERLSELINLYHRNPFILKIVGTRIREVFSGSVSQFLNDATYDFDQIHDLIEAQVKPCSNLEKEVLKQLAIDPQPLDIPELRDRIQQSGVTDAITSLTDRSLIEKSLKEGKVRYTLQTIVRRHIARKFVK